MAGKIAGDHAFGKADKRLLPVYRNADKAIPGKVQAVFRPELRIATLRVGMRGRS
ncbi:MULTISPECIES: hypothetical protein [Shinella]|jgi:hypothetical protein|uniref:hypothetical protein n=1 Tax=Shinella TaxID=323620 RepID=UPI0013C2FD97|nr:hypothetical protein [Shinella zoogloeoides]